MIGGTKWPSGIKVRANQDYDRLDEMRYPSFESDGKRTVSCQVPIITAFWRPLRSWRLWHHIVCKTVVKKRNKSINDRVSVS
jgi:hypothetical protein